MKQSAWAIMAAASFSVMLLDSSALAQGPMKFSRPGAYPEGKTQKRAECAMLTLTSTSPLPATGRGWDYSAQLQATGGQAPIFFNGLTYDARGVPTWGKNLRAPGLQITPSGLIQGQPAQAGYFTVRIAVSDSCPSGKQRLEKDFALEVKGATGPVLGYPAYLEAKGSTQTKAETPSSCPKIAITTPSPLPSTGLGWDYSAQLQATGGQAPIFYNGLTYDVRGLPTWGRNLRAPGLQINPSGLIHGQPAQAGYFTVRIAVSDSCPSGKQNIQKDFVLEVKGGTN